MLKTNYRHQNFGKLYSYATSLNKIMMLVITFAYGYLLDYNNFAFVYVFPVVAVLGVVSLYILTGIPFPTETENPVKTGIIQPMKASLKEMSNILIKNVPYRHFEIGFMFYGIFAASMVLLWNIGSAYFCKTEQAGTYQSLHLSLTGVRAIFAPILGVFFFQEFGFTVTFGIAIFSLLIAIGLMIWSYGQDKKTRGKLLKP